MKNSKEVIADFNDYVNMTAEELESWLKSDDSNSAGWPKENGDGESVGHDSGRKIVEILKSNPQKKADKYTDEQVQHMRKVVAYCKRHLAQEKGANSQKSPEEVKKTKSYASLKNWGHDFLKAQGQNEPGSSRAKSPQSEKDKEDEDGEEEEEEEEEEEANDDKGEQEKSAGDKRKRTRAQTRASKKRETRKGATTKKTKQNEEDAESQDEEDEMDVDESDEGYDGSEADANEESAEDDNQEEVAEVEESKGNESEDEDEKADEGNKNGTSKKPKKGPSKGDTVSWNWGSGQPQGKVLDVKGEKTTIKTKRGNEVSRDGDPEDPAVVLDTGKSKAIKSAHELN